MRLLFLCLGGSEMKNTIKPVIQPINCRGCIWGRWQDTVQYCSKPVCVKDTIQIPKRLRI